MAKSKAEIQKAYIERKKLREGKAYFKKERERIKAYYVPIDETPQRKAEERHQKVREWVRQHRLKNKNKSKTVTNNLEQSAEVSLSSSDVTSRMNTELHFLSHFFSLRSDVLNLKLSYVNVWNKIWILMFVAYFYFQNIFPSVDTYSENRC